MNKQEFLSQLQKALSGLPQHDIEERLTFYNEMIEDRIEEGFSEEQAISEIGSVREIAAQAVSETPLVRIAKERIRPKRKLSAVEIVLLILGSPIWLSLGIAAFAVIVSLYSSLWAVIISLWSVFVSLAVCSAVGLLSCVVHGTGGSFFYCAAIFAAVLLCTGLSIFMFFGCKALTIAALKLTKRISIWIKKRFIKEEDLCNENEN